MAALAGGTYRGDTKVPGRATKEIEMNEHMQPALQADVEAYFEALVRELEVPANEPTHWSDRIAA